MRGRGVVGLVALGLAPLIVLALGRPALAEDVLPAPAAATPASAPPSAATPAETAMPTVPPVEGAAHAATPTPDKEGFQLELGLFGGVHIFADNLELGVADAPGVPHPKTGAELGLRAAVTMLPWASLEGEFAYIPSADSIHNYRLHLLTYKLHVLVHLMHGRLRPFVLAGIGGMQVAKAQPNPGPTEIATDTDFDFHAGVGVKYAVTDMIDLRADARVVFLPNTKHNSDSADLEFLGAVGFRFGGSSPPPPPPVLPLVKDTDRDDIPDNVDKCPNDPEDKDGFQDADGCPDPDNDADGVPDAQDKCPTEKETINGYLDNDGCPDEVPAAVKKFTGVIKGINFKKNSADIQKSSFKLLADAVKVMKDYPDVRIEISGHTSSEGIKEKNQALSQSRADSVKKYLESLGIAGDRIVAIGYGSDKPIGNNLTAKGREQNRRIEFRLLTNADAAPGAAAAPASGGAAVPPPAESMPATPTASSPAPAAPDTKPAIKLPPAGEPMPAK